MNTKEALKSFELDARLFYDAVTFSTDDYLYIIDMSRDMALVSDNMREDFGLPDSLVPGLIPLWRDLIVERDRVRFDESIDDMLSGKTDIHDVEYQIKNVDDENIWVVCRGLMKRDEHNDPTMFAGVVTCLERKGKVDSVTGLFTHDECVELLDRLIGCESEGGVMLLGLDDFSRINSLNDHAFGNTVLRLFAQSTQRLLPEGGSMFRLDGDMFAVIVDGADRAAMKELYDAVHIGGEPPAHHRRRDVLLHGIGRHRDDRPGRHHRAGPVAQRRERARGKASSAARTLPRSTRPR